MIVLPGTSKKVTVLFLARCFFCLFALHTGFALAKAQAPGLPISQIDVQGNKTTQRRFLLKWSKLSIGELFSRKKIEVARQNILDTGLFKQVTIRTKFVQSRLTLVIEVEEKIYTLLLPRISRNSDGDLRLGVNLKLHNISGANQTLNLLAEKTKLDNGDDGRRYRVLYELPQYGRPYRYQIGLSDSVTNTENNGFRNTEYEEYASFSVTRDWNLSPLSYPLAITTSIIYQRIRLDAPYPAQLNELSTGKHSRFELKVEHDAIHTQKYRRYGYFYSLEVQQGSDLLSSDYSSRTIKIESRFYQTLNQLDNFNSRLIFGFSKRSPFSIPYYELGGSGTLRGLEQESIRGDALLLGNFEYIKGFESYPSFRASGFIDIGNTYPDLSEVDFSDLHTSIGFGGRWKALSFVKTDLFIDYAYNFDTNNSKIYAGTSLTF